MYQNELKRHNYPIEYWFSTRLSILLLRGFIRIRPARHTRFVPRRSFLPQTSFVCLFKLMTSRCGGFYNNNFTFPRPSHGRPVTSTDHPQTPHIGRNRFHFSDNSCRFRFTFDRAALVCSVRKHARTHK